MSTLPGGPAGKGPKGEKNGQCVESQRRASKKGENCLESRTVLVDIQVWKFVECSSTGMQCGLWNQVSLENQSRFDIYSDFSFCCVRCAKKLMTNSRHLPNNILSVA